MASPAGFASRLTDTIAAVASPPGEGARAILRLSGPGSFAVLASLFRVTEEGAPPHLLSPSPYRVLGGEVLLGGWEVGLPALAYLMPAPRSYTREDVAEVHLVGSPAVVMAVLEACLDRGARLAQPGEFTRRALLAGRLDLAQAEAVLKLVDAEDEPAARAAVGELAGSLGRRIGALAEGLFALLTRVEAAIDFSQEDIELIDPAQVAETVAETREQLETLLSEAREAPLRPRPTVLLFGRTNVGKSSLFNRLVGRTAALVTPVAGTTRDAVEAALPLRDIRVRLLDGAGQQEEDLRAVNARAAERTRGLLDEADLVCHLIDSGEPTTEEDRRLSALSARRPHLWVLSKSDLPCRVTPGGLAALTRGEPVLRVSAVTGAGVEELRRALRETLFEGRSDAGAAGFRLNARQREALSRSARALEAAQRGLEENLGEEFVAADLWEALDALGEVTGRRTSEDVLEAIFANFCTGK